MGCKKKEIPIGQRFGKLTVIESAPAKAAGAARWLCRCDCGETKVIDGRNLRKLNGTVSCGCYQKQRASINTRRYLVRTYKGYALEYFDRLETEDEG